MPHPESFTPGDPIWADLFSSDKAKSTAFYGELFGWEFESAGPDFGDYLTFIKDGSGVGGCMLNDGASGAPDAWSVYLAVEDADATSTAAVAHGAQVIVPAMQVGPLGTMLVLTDPGDAAIGAWQPAEHKGFGLTGEPGTPNWFELLTRNYDASVAFYTDVFGWDAHTMGDTPEFRYTTLGGPDNQRAGLMDASGFLPEGMPSHWSVYFGTADADASVAKAIELGGALVLGPEDTPYGRLAQMTDTTGANFKLIQPPEA